MRLKSLSINLSKHIFLTGLPGCGKSFTGKKLARELNFSFFDLDYIIESQENRTIAQIFSIDGENQFRKLEKKHLDNFIIENSSTNYVLSLGGGTVCYFDSLAMIKKNGVLVFINAATEICYENLKNEINKRPMFNMHDETQAIHLLNELYEKRKQYYLQADIVLNTKEIDLLAEKIKKYPGN